MNKIDGIDVSECGFCCWKHNGSELIENYCAVFNNKCICNPNCYFKQLKRLQEENEELKIYIESNKQQVEEVETLVMDNNRLQQETENLKDIIYYDVEKYKQALEEIREIAEQWLKNDWSCYYCRSNMDEKLKEIIKLTRF